jgi:hypothetical protein
MSYYCTIEEAWGDELNKDKRNKKKKDKRMYNTQLPEYIEDQSYDEGIHNNHCEIKENDNLNQKNKNRHKYGRKARRIKSNKQNNVEISYNDAQKEYNHYKKETKRIKESKNDIRDRRIIVDNNLAPGMYSGFSDNEKLYDYNSELDIGIEDIKKDDIDYTRIQNEFSEGMDDDEYLQTQKYDMDLIEGFESNGEELDGQNISRNGNDDVKDVEVSGNNKSKRAGNLIDKLLNQKKNTGSPSSEEMSSDEETLTQTLTDSDINTTDDELPVKENKENKEEPLKKISKKDIDYRLNSLNRSMNTIIKQMNKSQFFDDDSQDNIHDLILFILFGIFIIFILDSIYKLGKSSSNNVY